MTNQHDRSIDAVKRALSYEMKMAGLDPTYFGRPTAQALIVAYRDSRWNEGMDDAPKDRWIIVQTDEAEGLPSLVCPCRYHPDAGFTVCELRAPIRWQEMPRGL